MPALSPTVPVALRRAALTGAAALSSLVLLAAPALAHVTVQGPGATQGGYSKLTFRVPTEKDVPTTKVEVVLPSDAPVSYVGIKPHAGWTYTLTRGKPATPISGEDGPVTSVVTGITWTATAGGIKPGEFDEFDVSMGPLPKVDTMTFKALQTYSDGSVVRWIETAAPGGAEPEHPAPVLRLTAADAPASASPAAAAAAVDTRPAAAVQDEGTDTLGIVGVVLGALALLVAVGALVRRPGRGAAAQ